MTVLEISNWYSQNLEQISISISSEETWIFVGSDGKNELLSGILGYLSPKQGEISYYFGKKAEKEPWAVFGDGFLRENISPQQWGRIFAVDKADKWDKSYDFYLDRLNLPANLPLFSCYDRYKCALALILARQAPLFLLEIPELEENEEIYQWKQCLRECFRLIRREKSAKIIFAKSLSLLPTWMMEEGKIGIFSGKKLVLQGAIASLALEKNTCSIAQWKAMPPQDYLWKKYQGDEILLIQEKSPEICGNSQEIHREPCSLQEFMELLEEGSDV